MKPNLSRLGGQLGVGLCVAGFLLIFLGWNGAASNDLVVEQMPYLLSGGASGLALVAVGVAMIVVQNQRADRVALQSSLDALRDALERGAGTGSGGVARSFEGDADDELVVAGRASYHRPNCHLAVAREDAAVLTVPEAAARGLEPCRICSPEVPSGLAVEPLPASDEDDVDIDESEYAPVPPAPRSKPGRRQLRSRS